MLFRQYELPCLSLFSYLIGDETTGRAVVVDPQRDISGYLDDAAAHGLRIERVIETHFHADFLSGHLELAAATGAVISYGDRARAEFPIDPLADGQRDRARRRRVGDPPHPRSHPGIDQRRRVGARRRSAAVGGAHRRRPVRR